MVRFEPHPNNTKAITPYGFEINASEATSYPGKAVGLLRAQDFVTLNASDEQYYHVNEPSDDADYRAKCSDDDIGFIRAVFCDIDPDKKALAEDFSAERARIRQIADRLWETHPQPTMIVDSGGGVQMLWVLDEKVAVTDETYRLFDQIEHNILSAIPESDKAVRDISRILRLPGSVNRKRPGNERLVRLYKSDGPKYTLDELAAAWPHVDLPVRGAGGSTKATRSTKADETSLIATIQSEAPGGLMDALAAAPGLLGRLARDGSEALPGADRSGSAYRWHLARAMAGAGYDFNAYWHAARALADSYGRNPWGSRDAARAWIDVARREGRPEAGAAFEAVDEDLDAQIAAALGEDEPASRRTTARAFKRGSIIVDRTRPLDAAEEAARYLAPFHADRDDNLVVQGGFLLTLGKFDVLARASDGTMTSEPSHGLVEVSPQRLEQIATERADWSTHTEDGPKPVRVRCSRLTPRRSPM